MVREYNKQETNSSALRVDVHNLKQTCNHLFEFIKDQPTYEQFITEVESLHEELSSVNWEDQKLAEVVSQQLVVVLNLFTQASQLGGKVVELEETLAEFRKEATEKEKSLTESLKSKEKSLEDYHQCQLRLMKEKE
mgnify:CR=1 FL=1